MTMGSSAFIDNSDSDILFPSPKVKNVSAQEQVNNKYINTINKYDNDDDKINDSHYQSSSSSSSSFHNINDMFLTEKNNEMLGQPIVENQLHFERQETHTKIDSITHVPQEKNKPASVTSHTTSGRSQQQQQPSSMDNNNLSIANTQKSTTKASTNFHHLVSNSSVSLSPIYPTSPGTKSLLHAYKENPESFLKFQHEPEIKSNSQQQNLNEMDLDIAHPPTQQFQRVLFHYHHNPNTFSSSVSFRENHNHLQHHQSNDNDSDSDNYINQISTSRYSHNLIPNLSIATYMTDDTPVNPLPVSSRLEESANFSHAIHNYKLASNSSSSLNQNISNCKTISEISSQISQEDISRKHHHTYRSSSLITTAPSSSFNNNHHNLSHNTQTNSSLADDMSLYATVRDISQLLSGFLKEEIPRHKINLKQSSDIGSSNIKPDIPASSYSLESTLSTGNTECVDSSETPYILNNNNAKFISADEPITIQRTESVCLKSVINAEKESLISRKDSGYTSQASTKTSRSTHEFSDSPTTIDQILYESCQQQPATDWSISENRKSEFVHVDFDFSQASEEQRLELIHKQKMKKLGLLLELLETEKAYVDDLKLLVDNCFDRLNAVSWLPLEHKCLLIRNATDLVKFQQEFLDDMNDNLSPHLSSGNLDKISLGKIFIDLEQKFEVYKQYCTQHDGALRILSEIEKKPEMVFILKEFKGRSQSRLDVRDYLIKPVQRICKYPLFLNELIKLSDEGSEEHLDLLKAHTIMQNVAADIDSAKWYLDNLLRTDKFFARLDNSGIQHPPRSETGEILLGNMLLIHCPDGSSPKLMFRKSSVYQLRRCICLQDCDISFAPDLHVGHSWSLYVRGTRERFVFGANTEKERKVWEDVLQQILGANQLKTESDALATESNPLKADRRNSISCLNEAAVSVSSPTDIVHSPVSDISEKNLSSAHLLLDDIDDLGAAAARTSLILKKTASMALLSAQSTEKNTSEQTSIPNPDNVVDEFKDKSNVVDEYHVNCGSNDDTLIGSMTENNNVLDEKVNSNNINSSEVRTLRKKETRIFVKSSQESAMPSKDQLHKPLCPQQPGVLMFRNGGPNSVTSSAGHPQQPTTHMNRPATPTTYSTHAQTPSHKKKHNLDSRVADVITPNIEYLKFTIVAGLIVPRIARHGGSSSNALSSSSSIHSVNFLRTRSDSPIHERSPSPGNRPLMNVPLPSSRPGKPKLPSRLLPWGKSSASIAIPENEPLQYSHQDRQHNAFISETEKISKFDDETASGQNMYILVGDNDIKFTQQNRTNSMDDLSMLTFPFNDNVSNKKFQRRGSTPSFNTTAPNTSTSSTPSSGHTPLQSPVSVRSTKTQVHVIGNAGRSRALSHSYLHEKGTGSFLSSIRKSFTSSRGFLDQQQPGVLMEPSHSSAVGQGLKRSESPSQDSCIKSTVEQQQHPSSATFKSFRSMESQQLSKSSFNNQSHGVRKLSLFGKRNSILHLFSKPGPSTIG